MTGRHASPDGLGRLGPSVVSSSVRWLVERGVGGTAIAAAICAVLGFGYLPYDVADQRRAESLLQHGTRVRVVMVEAHVDHEPSKGGGWWEVDGIRVRLPAVDGEEWIELAGLGQALVDSTLSDEADWRQGWQEVPDEVGYQAPLDVLYSVDADGQVNVMAADDVDEWAGSDEWRTSLMIGSVGLLVSLISGIGYLRVRRT